jgi:Tyrosine-protein kinase ephrin type A/B receptor-like
MTHLHGAGHPVASRQGRDSRRQQRQQQRRSWTKCRRQRRRRVAVGGSHSGRLPGGLGSGFGADGAGALWCAIQGSGFCLPCDGASINGCALSTFEPCPRPPEVAVNAVSRAHSAACNMRLCSRHWCILQQLGLLARGSGSRHHSSNPASWQPSTLPRFESKRSPAGWPSPPARQQRCGACVGGWASTDANASYCTMCAPGSYSPAAFSPACPPCPAGTYASSWGSTHCRHCVTGATFILEHVWSGVSKWPCRSCPGGVLQYMLATLQYA